MVESRPPVGWLEVHSENYFGGGRPLAFLEAARAHYPLSLHGVGLSLGTDGPLDRKHLARIKALVARLQPALVSEHVSWSITGGVYLNDLLPLPYTEEALQVICAMCRRRRTFSAAGSWSRIPRAICSSPIRRFPSGSSWRRSAGAPAAACCSTSTTSMSAPATTASTRTAYLEAMPREAVQEIHLAGHAVREIGDATLRIDDHGSAVCEAVWQLYAAALRRLGPVPTLIEWDSNVPELPVLVAEAVTADGLLAHATEARDAAAA